jgi:hypothetical protein
MSDHTHQLTQVGNVGLSPVQVAKKFLTKPFSLFKIGQVSLDIQIESNYAK